ncbi:CarD family transcriptional regulator [Candidatus Deianiraea vastatrix]|uniref:CarD-family RNA polymerase-binding transcription factor n=1 Tax=Candidatus Deianiraea vastatrix TaxID=2163644 RepID=A0A5B8XDF1_9RICK|nr:CarD family transcriptional regulator [Candidatus Deianiraea vastatrix]QED23270.1 Putative CarD-family RNA polymerase-binding transcription factor [Candidatus Deianiraea vastatrix]
MAKTGKIQKLCIFNTGEFVVLPAHGVGKFVDYVELETSAGLQYFYKIHFEKNKSDVLIPESNLTNSGLRKIASKEIADKVFDVIVKAPRNQRGIWNKRMQEYDAKIYSGVLMNLAEVVRDGFICSIDPNKSYTERSKYKTALDRVCSELSVVFNESYEDVEKRLLSVLKSKHAKLPENDSFDLEFDAGDASEDSRSLDEDFAIEEEKSNVKKVAF